MAHVDADDDDDNLGFFYSRFIIYIRRMERVNRKYGNGWFAQPRRKRTHDNEPPIRRFIYTSPRYDGALCIGVGKGGGRSASMLLQKPSWVLAFFFLLSPPSPCTPASSSSGVNPEVVRAVQVHDSPDV